MGCDIHVRVEDHIIEGSESTEQEVETLDPREICRLLNETFGTRARLRFEQCHCPGLEFVGVIKVADDDCVTTVVISPHVFRVKLGGISDGDRWAFMEVSVSPPPRAVSRWLAFVTQAVSRLHLAASLPSDTYWTTKVDHASLP